jgi:hypothetical protein
MAGAQRTEGSRKNEPGGSVCSCNISYGKQVKKMC